MKRILLVALAMVLIVSLAACKDNSSDVDNTTTQAPTSDVGETGSSEVSTTAEKVLDNEEIKNLLASYPAEVTGLTSNIFDCLLKTTPAEFNGKSAVKVEVFAINEKEAQGVFFIVGDVFYKYDKAQNKYFKLTQKKAEEIKEDVKISVETTAAVTIKKDENVKTEEDIADENNNVLISRYKNYDLSKIGLPKPITEYEFQVTGKRAVATDGETVFIVYLLENGQYTTFTFAVGAEKDYYLDNSTGEYKPLS